MGLDADEPRGLLKVVKEVTRELVDHRIRE